MQTLSTQDRITKQRATIMRDPRFLAMAGIMMIGNWSVKDKPGLTAYTNGRDVVYGKEFIDKLNDKQLRFLILHEYYHVMLLQLHTWKALWKENAKLANIAADFVVNGMLDNHAGRGSDAFIEFIPGGCLDHQFDGMDTKQVFEKLKQQAKSGDNKGQGEPLDEHDTEGDGEAPELTEEEVQQLREQVDTAIRQAAQLAGKLGGKIDRSMTDLLEVSVDWREQLQDFVRSHVAGDDLATWRKPSRRWMARDIYLPSRYSESTKRITIGVDTSGSIGNDQLRRALTEIKGACDSVLPEILDIIYWDFHVAGHEKYEADAIQTVADVTKPVGGGGTRVGCMLDYMKKNDINPDCIIIFTDGYVESDWGGTGWPAPVLWCVSVKGMVAPNGKTLYVPVE